MQVPLPGSQTPFPEQFWLEHGSVVLELLKISQLSPEKPILHIHIPIF